MIQTTKLGRTEVETTGSVQIKILMRFRDLLESTNIDCGVLFCTGAEGPFKFAVQYDKKKVREMLKEFRKNKLI